MHPKGKSQPFPQKNSLWSCVALFADEVGHFLATWDGSAFLSPGHSSLESLKEVLQATLEATEKEFSTVKVKPATRKKRAASDSGDV
jgi:hypothetical protein